VQNTGCVPFRARFNAVFTYGLFCFGVRFTLDDRRTAKFAYQPQGLAKRYHSVISSCDDTGPSYNGALSRIIYNDKIPYSLRICKWYAACLYACPAAAGCVCRRGLPPDASRFDGIDGNTIPSAFWVG